MRLLALRRPLTSISAVPLLRSSATRRPVFKSARPPPFSNIDSIRDFSNRAADKPEVPQHGCLWRPCTAHKRCHIVLAAIRRRHEHFPPQQRYLRPNRYRRQQPHLFPHVPTVIRSRPRRERPARCLRQRYQLQRHSPPHQGIGTRSPVELKTDSTDRPLGRSHKTSRHRAWLRTMERLDRCRRIRHRRDRKLLTTRGKQIF